MFESISRRKDQFGVKTRLIFEEEELQCNRQITHCYHPCTLIQCSKPNEVT